MGSISKRNVWELGTPSGCLRLVIIIITISGIIPSASAQKDQGGVVGSVKDATGAVIPYAEVRLADVDRGVTKVVSTNGLGDYVASPLRIGRYTATVSKKGFRTIMIGPFDLQVMQRREVDFVLEVGQASQAVMVKGDVPLLETQTSELGQVVDNRTIQDMPLNGRNFAQLALLSAGVVPAEPGAANEQSFGFSSNGGRSYQNNYLLDGVDNNSNISDLQNGTSYVIQPSVDALQEFKVQTNSYDAEFGRGNGAVLNASIKSGTNSFHGDLYEYLRNDKLDARNFFEQRRGPYQQNQFGATVGGPIRIPHLYDGRNKSFFFADYEGLRVRQGVALGAVVPTPAMRSGDFTSALDFTSPVTDPATGNNVLDCNGVQTYAGELFNTRLSQVSPTSPSGVCGVPFGYDASGRPKNIIPTNLFDPLSKRLTKLWPLPNVNRAFNFLAEPKVQRDRNNFDVRADRYFSEKDIGFVRYSYQHNPSVVPAVFESTGGGGGEASVGEDSNAYAGVALSETHIFGQRLVNEFRFGYNRVHAKHLQFDSGNNISANLGIPGVPFGPLNGGLPKLEFSDVDAIGSPLNLPSVQVQNTFTYSDNLTWIRGKHSFKFGAEVRREEFTIFQPTSPRGHLFFDPVFTDNPGAPGTGGSGFASFLVGMPDAGDITNLHNVDYQRPAYAFYARDDFKISSKLTLNLGIRYDLFIPIREKYNAQATYDLGSQILFLPRGSKAQLPPSLAAMIPVQATASRGLVPIDEDNFAPRVGLAYKVNDRMVLRSGYGIFYSGYESGAWANPSPGFNPPFALAETFAMPCPAASANPAPGQLDCSIPGLARFSNGFPINALSEPNKPQLFSLDRHIKSPYMQQWHLSTETQLPLQIVLGVGYAGSKGTKLYTFFNGNQATPTTDPTSPFAARRPVPAIDAPIALLNSGGNSEYNSLQVRLERRFVNGFGLLTTYTWSHSLDNASNANLQSRNQSDYRWFAHPEWEHGNSDFDIRHRFVVSYIYELPFGRGKWLARGMNSKLDRLIGGWRVSGIATLNSGNWFTVLDQNANFSQSDGQQRPDQVQNPNAKPCIPGTLFNTCAFVDPPLGSFGNAGKNTVRGPSLHVWDLSIFKDFGGRERTHVEFRAEFFNVLNHANFILNRGTLGNPNFGFADQARDPRQIQFALKLYY